MSKEQETKIDFLKKWGAGFLGLISFIADIIAISELRMFQSTIQQIGVTNSPTYNPNFTSPTFGGFAIDDAIFLTGLLTVFVVTNLYYVAYKAKEITDKYSYIIATFLSLLLTYLYFRLWLGEKWWIFICIVPIFLLFLFVIGILGSGSTGSGNSSLRGADNPINAPPKTDNGGIYLPANRDTYELPSFLIGDVSQTPPPEIKPTISQPSALDEYWNNAKKEMGLDWNTTKKELGLDSESLKRDLGLDKSISEILFGDSQDDTMKKIARNWNSEPEPPEPTNDEIMEAIKKAWRNKDK